MSQVPLWVITQIRAIYIKKTYPKVSYFVKKYEVTAHSQWAVTSLAVSRNLAGSEATGHSGRGGGVGAEVLRIDGGFQCVTDVWHDVQHLV